MPPCLRSNVGCWQMTYHARCTSVVPRLSWRELNRRTGYDIARPRLRSSFRGPGSWGCSVGSSWPCRYSRRCQTRCWSGKTWRRTNRDEWAEMWSKPARAVRNAHTKLLALQTTQLPCTRILSDYTILRLLHIPCLIDCRH